MSAEEWRPALGMPHYEVSSHGRVRSIGHMTYYEDGRLHGFRSGRVLSTFTNDDGHLQASVMVDGRHCTRRVHVLMLEAFVGPRPPGQVGRHLNDVPGDNRLENLAWGTRSDNQYDAVRNGTHPHTRKTHCKRDHAFVDVNLTRGPTRRCRACNRTHAHFAGREIAEAEFRAYADQVYAKIMGGAT